MAITITIILILVVGITILLQEKKEDQQRIDTLIDLLVLDLNDLELLRETKEKDLIIKELIAEKKEELKRLGVYNE